MPDRFARNVARPAPPWVDPNADWDEEEEADKPAAQPVDPPTPTAELQLDSTNKVIVEGTSPPVPVPISTPPARRSRGFIRHDRHGRGVPKDPADDKPFRRFWDNIDHDAMEIYLSFQEKYTTFLAALHDPGYADLTYPTLCKQFNITLREMESVYADGQRHMAMIQMSNDIPDVAADLGEDAKSKMISCPRCDGDRVLRSIEEKDGKIVKLTEKNCPQCKGVGEVRQIGDKHARDVLFESMKFTRQSGPLLALQQNFNGGGGGEGLDAKMEGLMKMTQTIALESKNGVAAVPEEVDKESL